MYSLFFRNVIPSMIAFAFSGVYAIVDGLFVGRCVGDVGLAAISVAYPITAFIMACGTGVGMGTAVLISNLRGKGDDEGQKISMGNGILILCIISLLLFGVFYFSSFYLVGAFGAEGEILTMGDEYIKVIVIGTFFQVFGTGLVPLCRNFDGAVMAMVSMITGFLTNVVLDWVFVGEMGLGVAGAAWATVIGQALAILPSFFYLVKSGNFFGYAVFKFDVSTVREILHIGISPFGLSFSSSIVLMIVNKGAAVYGGQEAVACYAVVAYIVCVINMLVQGVGDGVQPIVSRFKGEDRIDKVKIIIRMAYGFSIFVALFGMVFIYLFRREFAIFYGASSGVVDAVDNAIPIFCAGFVFLAVLRVSTSCFYAMRCNKKAYTLIYFEPIVLGISVFLIFPRMFGIDGVWMAVPFGQFVMSLLALFYMKKYLKIDKTV